MKTIKVQVIFAVLIVLLAVESYAQGTTANNFFNRIKSYNLAIVLLADSVETEKEEGGTEKVKRPEILGFIGNDFQRFQIHFTSIIKNAKNPYQYFVDGKTMVKGQICSFNGTITIKQANISKSVLPNYQQGTATCEVILFEEKKKPNSGFIKGNLKSNFTIDNKQKFKYDALMLISDSFSNNQFIGAWTNYNTNISKKCNWGDYRIPDCGNLDIGAGDFYVSDKYVKNGWESYMRETKTSNTLSIKQKANNKNWWQ